LAKQGIEEAEAVIAGWLVEQTGVTGVAAESL
jgi:hypothetical protein